MHQIQKVRTNEEHQTLEFPHDIIHYNAPATNHKRYEDRYTNPDNER